MTNVEWDFGDGNTATDDQDVSHTYSGPGTYPVTADIDGDVGRLNVRVPALHLVMFSAVVGATEYTSGSIPSDLTTVDASGFLLSEVVPPATFDFMWLMENAEPVMVDPNGYFGDDGLGHLIRPSDATMLRADAWGTTVTSLPVGEHTAWVQLSTYSADGSQITFNPLPDEPRLEVTYTVTDGGSGGPTPDDAILAVWPQGGSPAATSGPNTVKVGLIKNAALPATEAECDYWTVGELAAFYPPPAGGTQVADQVWMQIDDVPFTGDNTWDHYWSVASQAAEDIVWSVTLNPVPPNDWQAFSVLYFANPSGAAGRTDSATYTVVVAEFDPAAYTVQGVIDHVTEHPDQVQAIYDAERDGQHRVTLLSYLTGHGAEP